MGRPLLSVFLFGAIGVALIPAGPVDASVRWGKCGTIQRIAGKGVACANGFKYDFMVGGTGETWVATLTTPMNQCAPLKFALDLDGATLKSSKALAAGKSETVVLGKALKAGAHVLVVKATFMFSECYPEEPPVTPGNWGVDTVISLQPE